MNRSVEGRAGLFCLIVLVACTHPGAQTSAQTATPAPTLETSGGYHGLFNNDDQGHADFCVKLRVPDAQIRYPDGSPSGFSLTAAMLIPVETNGVACPAPGLARLDAREYVVARDGSRMLFHRGGWGFLGNDPESAVHFGHVRVADIDTTGLRFVRGDSTRRWIPAPTLPWTGLGQQRGNGSACSKRALAPMTVSVQSIPGDMRYLNSRQTAVIPYAIYGNPSQDLGTPEDRARGVKYTLLSWSWINTRGGGVARSLIADGAAFYPCADVPSIRLASVRDTSKAQTGWVEAVYGAVATGNGEWLYGWTVSAHQHAGEAIVSHLLPPVEGAAKSDTSVDLLVTLDHPDWRYHVGDTARFRVSLARDGRAVPGARVRIEIGPERMKPFVVDTITAGPSGQTRSATLDHPGFVGLSARVVVGKVTYTQRTTAAFDPEKIVATTPMPSDFMEFWRDAITEARRVPLDLQMMRLPERSTPEVDAYHISFQNDRVGSRIYGMLAVPTKPGRYPAILTVPGAGVRPYFPDIATARKGVITLAIGIHGIPVDRDSLLYRELRATALKDYWAYRLEDRDNYFYKRVYVGVVRAGDVIASLPQFDGTNYAVQGGSQGGALSLVAGALDPRVKGVVVSHPALGDQFAFLHGHTSGWPFMLSDTVHLAAKAEKLKTIPYYDAVNFARVLKVPGMYGWGFNDLTVPPTASYAIYNSVTAPKELLIAKEAYHFNTPEQLRRNKQWLFSLLGVEAEVP